MLDNNEKRFKKDIDYRIYRIKHLGQKHGWELINHDNNILKFKIILSWESTYNCLVIMEVDYITLKMETSLNHPTKGKTQLMRKGEFTTTLIERIFRNPRTHTPIEIKSEYK